MSKGFTLIELLIALAIVGLLTAVVMLGVPPLLETVRARAQAAELARVEQAMDAYLLLSAEGLTARSTPAPIDSVDGDAPFVGYLRALPSRYAYSWDATGQVSQYLYEQAGQPLLTPLGNTPTEIGAAMLALMREHQAAHGSWARTWSPYCYSDLDLDAEFWGQAVEGVRYSPRGSYLGLANVADDVYQVYVETLAGNELHLYDGWSIWLSATDGLAYYHNHPRGVPGEVLILVDPSTLRVTQAP